MSFPDISSQEEMIHVIGDVELLRKAGLLILRHKKSTWGIENDRTKYELLSPYFTGRILNVGLGMGNSVDVILETCSEVIAYEIISEIIQMYEYRSGTNAKLTIIQDSIYTNKPDGTFQAVLFELSEWIPAEKTQILDCIEWVHANLESGGYLILEHNQNNVILITELVDPWNYTELSQGSGLGLRKKWMLLRKS